MRKKFMIEWSGIKPYIVGYLEQLCKKNDDYTELHDLKERAKTPKEDYIPIDECDHIPLHQKQDECVEGCKIYCECELKIGGQPEEGAKYLICISCDKPIKPTEIEEIPTTDMPEKLFTREDEWCIEVHSKLVYLLNNKE